MNLQSTMFNKQAIPQKSSRANVNTNVFVNLQKTLTAQNVSDNFRLCYNSLPRRETAANKHQI